MADIFLKEKSKNFALRIIKLYKFIQLNYNEFVISRQILKSGTSIGANIAEAFYPQSNADFISKLSISRKECAETLYWLELLFASEFIDENQYISLEFDCKELLKLLTYSIKKALEKENKSLI